MLHDQLPQPGVLGLQGVQPAAATVRGAGTGLRGVEDGLDDAVPASRRPTPRTTGLCINASSAFALLPVAPAVLTSAIVATSTSEATSTLRPFIVVPVGV